MWWHSGHAGLLLCVSPSVTDLDEEVFLFKVFPKMDLALQTPNMQHLVKESEKLKKEYLLWRCCPVTLVVLVSRYLEHILIYCIVSVG